MGIFAMFLPRHYASHARSAIWHIPIYLPKVQSFQLTSGHAKTWYTGRASHTEHSTLLPSLHNWPGMFVGTCSHLSRQYDTFPAVQSTSTKRCDHTASSDLTVSPYSNRAPEFTQCKTCEATRRAPRAGRQPSCGEGGQDLALCQRRDNGHGECLLKKCETACERVPQYTPLLRCYGTWNYDT